MTVAGVLADRPSGSEGYAAAPGNGEITLGHPHAPSTLFASTGVQHQSDRAPRRSNRDGYQQTDRLSLAGDSRAIADERPGARTEAAAAAR